MNITKEQMLGALAMLMLKERETLRHNPEVKKKLEAIRALIESGIPAEIAPLAVSPEEGKVIRAKVKAFNSAPSPAPLPKEVEEAMERIQKAIEDAELHRLSVAAYEMNVKKLQPWQVRKDDEVALAVIKTALKAKSDNDCRSSHTVSGERKKEAIT